MNAIQMKAYIIIDLKIVEIDGFMEYVARIPELIEKYGGKYLVQGVEPIVIEGAAAEPPYSVVLEFPSKTVAESFLEERSQSDLHEIWGRTTNSRILLAEGCN